MKTKKVPMRSCIMSKEQLPKQELIRIVKNKEGQVCVDLTGKKKRRGAYIKKDINILDKGVKSKILEKKLEVNIPSSIYDELRQIILDSKN